VPLRDVEALADRILWMLDNPDASRRVAEAARERVLGRYSRERMVEGTLALYGISYSA
jgi:glycosyltransferase involved in cell wall biosynthesis